MKRRSPKVRKGQRAEHFTDIRRELIENLRRNLLRPGECELLATQLERFWWPSSTEVKAGKKKDRRGLRRWKAEQYQIEIDHIAATEHILIGEAKVKVREKYKLQSVEALETYMAHLSKHSKRRSGARRLPTR